MSTLLCLILFLLSWLLLNWFTPLVAGFNSFFFIVLFLLWGTAVFSVNLFGVLWLTGGSPHRFGFFLLMLYTLHNPVSHSPVYSFRQSGSA
jgi:hypothetical protein